MPYAISSSNRNFTAGRRDRITDGDWGIDGKIGVTSSMTLDLTYNTDFAQVEVDEQQINLTRFNLLFPEKRPFFLENRGLFAVGRPGEIDLFFSRRIGIDDNGVLIPIQGGARLTGKASGVNVGLLNMQTESVGDTPVEQLHGGAREQGPAQSLERRRDVREPAATGSLAGDDNWNRTFGVDGKLRHRRSRHDQRVRGADPDARGDRAGARLQLGLRIQDADVRDERRLRGGRRRLQSGGRASSSGPTAIGRSARRCGGTSGRRALAKLGLRELEPHVSYESYWGFDGFQETATLHIDSRLGLRERLPAHVNRVERSVRGPAAAVRGLPGRHRAGRQLSQPVLPHATATPIAASGSPRP